jgi:hypothetical protein
MQMYRPGRPFSPLRLLVLLAVAVFAVPAAAADLDWIGPAERAQTEGPAQLAQACPRIYRPVCAFTGGQWRTYSNSCEARRRGARLIRQGACRATQPCSNAYRPVCGIYRGRRVTYRNICVGRRAGAANFRAGQCRPRHTCHQRGTSRRFQHIQGRSWPRACGGTPPPRTCHQRNTSRRYPHVRGRSWHPACRSTGGGGGGGRGGNGGGGVKPKPQAGAPCTGKDRHGITFQGRFSVDRNGIATCLGDSSRRPRP